MRISVVRTLGYLVWLGFLFSRPIEVAATESTAPDPQSFRISTPASARMTALVEDDIPQFEARLFVSPQPNPRIGVLFDLAPGWHLYWRNPGETGLAPRLEFEVTGHRVGELEWPSPTTFREADGLFTTYGYEDQVMLIAPLDAADADADANVEMARVEGSVLVCRTQCVPISFTLSTPLDPNLSRRRQATIDALFREFEARLPALPADLDLEAEAYWASESREPKESRRLELRVFGCEGKVAGCRLLAPGSGQSLFIPMEENGFEFSDIKIVSTEDTGGFSTIAMQASRLEPTANRLRGLITLRDARGQTRPVRLDLPILAESTHVSSLAPTSSILQIFFFALLGGLILNCMPCVLPILAIKVVAVAELADKEPRRIRLHGLAYTGGILASMALLSIGVSALRAAGHFVGWGFQFQEPLFIAAIAALLVAFAMNLFGVFEIELGQGRFARLGQDRSGLERSAFEGFIAVLLATPCSAPFLGTAVGFAFAASALGSAAIFLAIGLGLASPFLLVSFFPKLAGFIPRPGPWMIQLRSALAFGLLATVLWLLWVIGQTGGSDSVIATASSLLFLAFLLWGFGQRQPIQNLWVARAGVLAIAVISFGSFNLIDFAPIDSAEGEVSMDSRPAESRSGWKIYSRDAVARVLADGQPAFVVFTADWCITCQFNEHTVLRRQAIQDAFRDRNVALFEADWTRRNDAIRRRLADFGRAGVPLYLLYSPDAPNDPQILSELLSRGEILTALAQLDIAPRGGPLL